MASATRRGLAAAALSAVVPGAGQLYAGARRRGLTLIAIVVAALAVAAIAAAGASWPTLDLRLLVGVLAVDVAVLAFRLFAVVDAWLVARATATTTAVAGLAVLALLIV